MSVFKLPPRKSATQRTSDTVSTISPYISALIDLSAADFDRMLREEQFNMTTLLNLQKMMQMNGEIVVRMHKDLAEMIANGEVKGFKKLRAASTTVRLEQLIERINNRIEILTVRIKELTPNTSFPAQE